MQEYISPSIAKPAIIVPPVLSGRPFARGITIDDPQALAIDDAHWITIKPDRIRLDVSIIDPTDVIPIGSEADREARERLFSRYIPGISPQHMLPRAVLEEYSLSDHALRPVLTVSIDFDAQTLAKRSAEISEQVLVSRGRYHYDYAEYQIENNPSSLFRRWYEVADRLFRMRARSEAEALGQHVNQEWSPFTHNQIQRAPELARETKSRMMIREFLVAATDTVIEKMTEWGIPILPSSRDLASRNGRHSNARDRYEILFTSPLRHYSSLVTHRQIKAHLNGEPQPYTEGEIISLAKSIREAGFRYDREKTRARLFIDAMKTIVAGGSFAVMADFPPGIVGLVLARVIQHPVIDPELAAAFTARLDEGTMRVKDMVRILLRAPRDAPQWDQLRHSVVRSFGDHPGLCKQFTEAAQEDGFESREDWFSMPSYQNKVRLHLKIGDEWRHAAAVTESTKKSNALQNEVVAFAEAATEGKLAVPAASIAASGFDRTSDILRYAIAEQCHRNGWFATAEGSRKPDGTGEEMHIEIRAPGVEQPLYTARGEGPDRMAARDDAGQRVVDQWMAATAPAAN